MADRRLRLIIEAQNRAKEAFGKVEQDLQRLNTSVEKTNKSFAESFGAVTSKMQSMGQMMTVGVTAPLALLGRSAFKAYADMDSLKRGMIAVTGSAAAAAKEIERLKEVAKLPGLGFQEAIQGSVNLQAAGASADEARKYLSAFGNALATVGKGKNELDLVNLALTQLMNKASGFGQDIRQLQEQLPQIRQIMMKSFGTADTEEIAKMGLTGKQVVDAIATEFAKLPKMTGGARNAIENLSDAWFKAMNRIGEVMAPAITKAISWLEKLFDIIAKLPKPIVAFGVLLAGLAAAGGPLLMFAAGLASLIFQIKAYTTVVQAATAATAQLGAAQAAGGVAGGLKGMLGKVAPMASGLLTKGGPIALVAAAATAGWALPAYFMDVKPAQDQEEKSNKSLSEQERMMIARGWKKGANGRMISPREQAREASSKASATATAATSSGQTYAMPFAGVSATSASSIAKKSANARSDANLEAQALAEEQRMAMEANMQEERRAAWRARSIQATIGQTAAVVNEIQARFRLFETLEDLAGEYAKGKIVQERVNEAYAEYNQVASNTAKQQVQDAWDEYEKRMEAWAISAEMAGTAESQKQALLARIGTKLAKSLAFATTQGDAELANAMYAKELKNFDDTAAKAVKEKADRERKDNEGIVQRVIERVNNYRREADAYVENIRRQIEADRERQRSRIAWTNSESLWRGANVQGAAARFNSPLPFFQMIDNGSDPSQREFVQAYKDLLFENKKQTEKFDRMISLLEMQPEGAAF